MEGFFLLGLFVAYFVSSTTVASSTLDSLADVAFEMVSLALETVSLTVYIKCS